MVLLWLSIEPQFESGVMDGLRARGAGLQSFGREDAARGVRTIFTPAIGG